MHLKTFAFAAVSALTVAACGSSGGAGGARDTIRAVGSSTVYPFAKKVAEDYVAANQGMKSPLIESTGTGGGIKLFCAGLGQATPDMVNASRRMKASASPITTSRPRTTGTHQKSPMRSNSEGVGSCGAWTGGRATGFASAGCSAGGVSAGVC